MLTDPDVDKQPGMGLVLRAARFAAWKHRHQRRKGKGRLPYINPPLDLAHVLWFEGQVTDPIVLAAALLHDTVEDTQTSVQELQGEFGEQIAGIVMETTDEKSLDWRVRKKLQITRARGASIEAPRARVICNFLRTRQSSDFSSVVSMTMPAICSPNSPCSS